MDPVINLLPVILLLNQQVAQVAEQKFFAEKIKNITDTFNDISDTLRVKFVTRAYLAMQLI